VQTVRPGTPAATARERMRTKNIHHLLVMEGAPPFRLAFISLSGEPKARSRRAKSREKCPEPLDIARGSRERSRTGASEASRRASILDSILIASVSGRWHRRLVWFVYILRCSDNSLYIGETDDVAARGSRHNDGRGSSFTASRRPVRLVWSESQESREDALERERQLKGWTRAKKEALIAGDMAALKRA
jgi:predicted GIY-YIG superfamily endonuclease